MTLLAARAFGRAGLGRRSTIWRFALTSPSPGWLTSAGVVSVTIHGAWTAATISQTAEENSQYRINPAASAEGIGTRMLVAPDVPGVAFHQSVVWTRLPGTGRVTLSDRTLIETIRGERKERTLAADSDVLAAYRAYVGVTLERVPTVRQLGSC